MTRSSLPFVPVFVQPWFNPWLRLVSSAEYSPAFNFSFLFLNLTAQGHGVEGAVQSF